MRTPALARILVLVFWVNTIAYIPAKTQNSNEQNLRLSPFQIKCLKGTYQYHNYELSDYWTSEENREIIDIPGIYSSTPDRKGTIFSQTSNSTFPYDTPVYINKWPGVDTWIFALNKRSQKPMSQNDSYKELPGYKK